MSAFTTLTSTLKKSFRFYKNTELRFLHVHKTSKMETEFNTLMEQSTASLDNLYQCLKTLTGKIFFSVPKLHLPFVFVTTGHGKKSS